LAETPARKRPVSAKRPATPRPTRAAAPRPRARPRLEDEATSTNYALRLTEGLDDDVAAEPVAKSRRGLRPTAPTEEDNFALRLNEALEAIAAAQGSEEQPAPASNDQRATRNAQRATLGGWLASFDKLPPIRLPIGPPIPWRVGLPVLVTLIVVMGFIGRPSSQSDPQLPPAPTYPVQQTAPLFTNAQPTDVPAEQPTPVPAPAQPIGVQDPAGLGFDFVDIGIKLIAVLALAYGSMMLLKRLGVGGIAGSSSQNSQTVRVVSSVALAPNRSVHVIKVPGGKTLLIGATPSAVNLLAELSENSE
jgi:flagellar biogenesis protein FliO